MNDCWGPGNYSCNDFITVVDPHIGYTLDGTQGGYKEWAGDDSFLQGRTYDSGDIAVSGWYYEYEESGDWPTYMWLYTDVSCTPSGCGVGRLFRHSTEDYYGWNHSTTTETRYNAINWFDGAAINNWRFVVGST